MERFTSKMEGFKTVQKIQSTRKLFAGIECPECTKKSDNYAKEEVAKGHVCRLCGQPYSRCCC